MKLCGRGSLNFYIKSETKAELYVFHLNTNRKVKTMSFKGQIYLPISSTYQLHVSTYTINQPREETRWTASNKQQCLRTDTQHISILVIRQTTVQKYKTPYKQIYLLIFKDFNIVRFTGKETSIYIHVNTTTYQLHKYKYRLYLHE